MTKGKRKRGVEAGSEGEAEKPAAIRLWSEVKGVSVNPEGESRRTGKMARKERENQTIMETKANGKALWERCKVRKEKRFGWNLKRRRMM